MDACLCEWLAAIMYQGVLNGFLTSWPSDWSSCLLFLADALLATADPLLLATADLLLLTTADLLLLITRRAVGQVCVRSVRVR